jgi:uncharacterized protein (DUF2141 family)
MKAIKGVLLAGLVATLAGGAHAQSICALVVHVNGFRNQKGDAGVTIFRSANGWPENNDKAFQHGAFPITGPTATARFELPPGRYAVAALHDENSNHKLDRNFLHIPKEGFGFANNPWVGLSAPSFDKAAIRVSCPETEITIRLIYR